MMTPEDRAIGLLIKLHRDHDIYVVGAAKEPIQTAISAAENDALERAANLAFDLDNSSPFISDSIRALKHTET